eukprot:3728952-Rhodomonas_salina.4
MPEDLARALSTKRTPQRVPAALSQSRARRRASSSQPPAPHSEPEDPIRERRTARPAHAGTRYRRRRTRRATLELAAHVRLS